MFLRKYTKNSKDYYILTFVFQNGNNKKPDFKKCFIPEKLALILIKSGVELKNEK